MLGNIDRLKLTIGLIISVILCLGSNAHAQSVPIEVAGGPICSDGSFPPLDSITVDQIERCLRARGADPFNSQELLEKPDLQCEHALLWFDGNHRSGESIPSPAEVKRFCARVADAHERIYSYRPYWESCREPAAVSDEQLKTCVRGLLRTRESWPRPDDERYVRECRFATSVYINGYKEGNIVRYQGNDRWQYDLADAMDCSRVQQQILSLRPEQNSICYADEEFYNNRLAFFEKCMGQSIDSNLSCHDFRQLYVEKLGSGLITSS